MAQLRQHRLAFGRVLHEAQEYAIGFEHIAAMDERHPVIEPFLQRTFEVLGLLVRPHNIGLRRGAGRRSPARRAGIMAGRL